jgi:hypothetical protein
MRRLISDLLDDARPRDGYRRAFTGERMMSLQMVLGILNGAAMSAGPGQASTAWHPITRAGTRPMLYHNANLIVDYETAMLPLADEPDWPAAKDKLPPHIGGFFPLTFLAQILTPSLDRAVQTHFRVLVERHMAAAALAVRWYAVEHDGTLPATLDELVPKYLPAVPSDTLAAHQPIKYLSRAANPIVYSVGENGTDDGGSEASTNPRDTQPGEWQMQDRVIHLTRQPRPSTQPVDQQ